MRLGGLASGLDTETLVSSLMAAERGPRIRLDARQQVVEARKTTLQDIQNKLRALQTATADLRSPLLFLPTQSVETSDASRVGVTRTGSVGVGAYMVKVTQVAAAEQRSYAYTPQGAQSDFTVDGHTTKIPANASLADAVAAINGDADGKVYASEVNGRLALSWRATGTAANDDAVVADALGDETLLRAGRNALLEVDGVPKTSQSNTFTEIPGLTLALKAPTTADVAITVGPPQADLDKVKSKLKAFVDAYNAANDLMRNELREERVPNAANRVDRGKGVLRGDAAISQLQSQLRQALTQTFPTGSAAVDQLADLGITTGGSSGSGTFSRDAVNGRLTLDDTKLGETLAADPARVRTLLSGPEGLAQALDKVLTPALGAGGAFESRVKSADAEIARLKTAMTTFDERLSLREKALRATFTRLEQSLQGSNTQSSYLAQQLAALYR
jgi:flagellar hook-associated protein 2